VRPAIEIVGVECALYPSMWNALHGQDRTVGGATLAEGIAVKNVTERTIAIAKQYVDDPDLHDPAMTHFLLLDVLQSQQQILLWTAQWGVYYKVSFRRSLPSPYRYFVSPLLGVVIYVASIGLLWWLDTRDHSVLAIILTVWMCYWYLIQRPNTWWQRSRARKHFSRLAQLLAVPIYEIRSKTYDPDTIRRRLEACDQHDLYIASIAFALLKVLPTSFAVRT